MFLLVPAYPGCPGSKAVKRSLLLLTTVSFSSTLAAFSQVNFNSSVLHNFLPPLATGTGFCRMDSLIVIQTTLLNDVPPRRRHQFPSDQLAVGSVQVTPAASVRDLGVYLHSNMSLRSHVTRLACTCFGFGYYYYCYYF